MESKWEKIRLGERPGKSYLRAALRRQAAPWQGQGVSAALF